MLLNDLGDEFPTFPVFVRMLRDYEEAEDARSRQEERRRMVAVLADRDPAFNMAALSYSVAISTVRRLEIQDYHHPIGPEPYLEYPKTLYMAGVMCGVTKVVADADAESEAASDGFYALGKRPHLQP